MLTASVTNSPCQQSAVIGACTKTAPSFAGAPRLWSSAFPRFCSVGGREIEQNRGKAALHAASEAGGGTRGCQET